MSLYSEIQEKNEKSSNILVGPAISSEKARSLGLKTDSLIDELESIYKDYVSGNPEAEAQKRWDAERVGVPMWIQERDEMYAKEAKARSALLNKGLPDFEYVVGKYPLTAGFFYNRDVMASAHDDIFALAGKEAEAERLKSLQKQLKGNLSRRTSWQTDNIFNKPADPRPRGAEAAQRWLKNTSFGGERSLDTGVENFNAVDGWMSDTSFGRGVASGYEMSAIGTEAVNLFASASWTNKNDEAKWVDLEKRLLALDRGKPDGWFSGMLYETGKFIGQQGQGAFQTGILSAAGAGLGVYGAGAVAGGAMLAPAALPVLALGAMSGWLFGAKMGAFTQSAKVEAGLDVIQRRMMTDEDGNYLSPLAVGLGSMTVGAVNGALELMQWKIAGAPLASVAKKVGTPAAMKRVSTAVAGRLAKLPVKAQIAGLAAKDILINDFAESLTEVAQDLVPITVDEMQKAALLDGYDRRTLADVTSQLTDTFLESVYSFLLVSAVGPFGGAIGGNYRFELMRRDIEAAETIRQGKIFDGFKGKVLATKLFSRYPGMSKEHSKNLLEHADTNKVFLSANAVQTLYQSGKFADSGYESAVDWAVDNLGVTEEDYNRSITEDYDMEVEAVNLYDVLDDNEGLMKELAGEARFVRDGYTLKEAEKARADLRLIQQEDLFRLQTGINFEADDIKSANVVSEAFRIQLMNAGVDDETAAADGLIAGKMFIPIARNLNNLMPLKDGKRWTPEAASKLYKLAVERDANGKPGKVFLEPAGNNAGTALTQNSFQKKRMAYTLRNWGANVDRVFNAPDKSKMSGLVHVMETPLVLSLVGGNYINKTGRQGISISESKMLKIQQEHNLSTAVVKQIPKAMADPIAIFESAENEGKPGVNDVVFMLDLKDDNGATVVAAVWLEQDSKQGLVFNRLASYYGKDKVKEKSKVAVNDDWFVRQNNKGKMLYVNTKKALHWTTKSGLLLPSVGSNGELLENIPSERDLVKLRQENPTFYQALKVGGINQTKTDSFKDWFGDWENDPENASKVVDKKGRPLVVYHGTGDDFNEFKKDKLGSRETAFFFTSSKKSAQEYGWKLMPVFLNAKRFVRLDDNYRDANGINYNVESEEFKQNFDGYSVDEGTDYDEFVIFNPTNIKSATGNIGTFNNSNANIYLQSAYHGNVYHYQSNMLSTEAKTALPEAVFDSYDEAKKYLHKKIENGQNKVTNLSTNEKAMLSSKGIGKMLSAKAVKKSQSNGFTEHDHITAAASILKFYKNAELLLKHPDLKNRSEISSIKRFGAPIILSSGELAEAYITVQDNQIHGNKIYSIELLELKKMPSGYLEAHLDIPGALPYAEGTNKLSEKFNKINSELTELQQGGTKEPFGKITLPARDGDYARITLGANANKSTFVHELAHFYLYILRDMSSRKSKYNDPTWEGEPAKWNRELKVISGWWRENAEAIAKEASGYAAKSDGALDGDAFISWVNGGMEKDSEAGLAFDRAAHEYFARGFERYLAEGEAPSAEMQSVFRKFKRWLCEIYRNLTQLDVELSDEIRGVFDRMLATDDAIRRVQAQRNLDRAMEAFAFENGGELEYSSIAEEAPGVGVDVDSLEPMPDEYESAAERVLRELLKEMSPEQADEFEKRSAEVRSQASSEVMRDPGFSAMLFIVDNEELRLNKQAIVDAFGQELADAMPPNTTADEGGMKDLEIAAKGFNFASADDMVASLVGKPTINEAINRRVKEILAPEFIEKHKNAQKMADMAEAALYEGEERSEAIAAEAELDFDALADEAAAEQEREDEFRYIFEADDAARREAEEPGSRTNVAKFIRKSARISYKSVATEFGREFAQALKDRYGNFIFSTKGRGLDDIAQELTGMGIPINGDQGLYNLLMSDITPESPINLARAEARAEAMEEFREKWRKLKDEAKGDKEKLKVQQEKLKKKYDALIQSKKAKYEKMEEGLRRRYAKKFDQQKYQRLIDKHLKDLTKIVGNSVDAKTLRAGAKQAAALAVSDMRVQDLYNPDGWVRAEREARNNGDRALRNIDEVQFKHWRTRELYAHEMVKAIYTARSNYDYMRRKMVKYAKRGKVTFGMDTPYLYQLDMLLSRFDLSKMTQKEILAMMPENMRKDVQSLAEFIAEQAEAGVPLLIPDWIARSGERTNLLDLKVSQVAEVYNAMRNIITTGRDEKRTITRERNLELTGIERELHYRTLEAFGKTQEDINPNTELVIKKKKPSLIVDVALDLNTVEAMCRRLDGFQDFGPWQDYVFRPIRSAMSREYLELNRMFEAFRKHKEEVYGGKFVDDGKKIDVGVKVYERTTDILTGKALHISTDKVQYFTKEEIICAALNMGNKDNIARLKDGWGWTESDIEKIKEKMTEQDWRYVQGVWDLLDSMWPQIKRVHELMTGTTIQKVEKQAVETKFGDFAGGYYPIVTDLRYSKSAAAQDETSKVMASAPMNYASKQTKNGHRLERAENVLGRPPILSFGVLDNHVANVIHDYEMAPVIRDVRKILHRDMVSNTIVSVYGHKGERAFNRWLNDIAANTKNNGVVLDPKDKAILGVKNKTSMFALGANAGGALMQTLGYLPLAHRIGFKNMAMAILNGMSAPEKTYQFVLEKSEFMREQMGGSNSSIREIQKNWTTNDRGLSRAADLMLSIYPLCQNLCNVPGWMQCYKKGMADFGGDEAKAVAYADSVIRQTQGASTIADLTAFERSGPLGQLLTMFYSWFRVMHQMQVEALVKVKYEHGLYNKTRDLASYVFYVLIAQSLVESFLRNSLPDPEDDDDYKWVKWTAKRLMVAPLSTIPVVRDVAGAIDNDFKYGVRISPAQDAFESLYRLIKVASKQSQNFMEDEEVELDKLVSAGATVVGYRYGIPNRKMIQAAEAFLSYYSDDEAIPILYLLLGSGYKPKND